MKTSPAQSKTKLGFNSAIFDGHPEAYVFETLKKAGVRYVELAYNRGYTGQIGNDLFSPDNADRLRREIAGNGLETVALGCTFDLGEENAALQLELRIRFAQRLGVTWLNICTGAMRDRAAIINCLKRTAPVAEDAGCRICIENGGDANYDAFATAEDGISILEEVDHPALAVNYDPGNTCSLRPGLNLVQEVKAILPYCAHFHIKDVVRDNTGYWFPPIGQGMIDYETILKMVFDMGLPCSLEIPLRMHRKPDAWPVRSDTPVERHRIETVIQESLAYIRSQSEQELANS